MRKRPLPFGNILAAPIGYDNFSDHFFLAMGLFTACRAFGAPTESPPIRLAIDRLHQMKIPPGAPLTVGHKALVQAVAQGQTLTLKGKKIGKTFVDIQGVRYPVIIAHKPVYKTAQDLERWIHNKRGLRLRLEPRGVSIEGTLLRIQDFYDLSRYLKSPSSYIFRPQISKDLQIKIRKFIQQRVLQKDLPQGHLTFSPQLEYGIPETEQPRAPIYKNLLAPFGVTLVFNKNVFVKKPLIQVQVFICQVSQRFFQHYGLQWPTVAQGEILGTTGEGWAVGTQMNFGAHALEQSGLGKVLASPTLTTKSGTKASFHSGGEFPINSQGSFFNQVQWKKHGILLDIKPVVDHKKRIDIDIKAEISLLDHSKAQNGVPAIEKSEVQSTFQWLGSRPIVLSGLLKRKWYDTSEGLPLLGQIPLLGPIFSHKEESQDQTELIFLIQAKVLEND